MTQAHKRISRLIGVLLALALGGHALAETPGGSKPDEGEPLITVSGAFGNIVGLPVDAGRHSFTLLSHPDRPMIMLFLIGPIGDIRVKDVPDFKTTVWSTRQILIKPKTKDTRASTRFAVESDGVDLRVRVKVAESSEKAADIAIVVKRDVFEAYKERKRERLRQRGAQIQAEVEKEVEKEARQQALHALLTEQDFRPVVDPGARRHDSGDPVRATVQRARITGGKRLAILDVDNRAYDLYKAAHAYVYDAAGTRYSALAVVGSQPPTEELIGVIGAQERAEVAIEIPDVVRGPFAALRFELTGPDGARPVVAAAQTWDFVPVPPEEVERRARMKQTAVFVRALGGMFWLDDGTEPGGQNLAVTGIGGVGMRVQKGWENGVALEGEVMMGKTGEASFGDVIRSATLGRVQANGVIRLGSKYVTSVRLGFGLQGASYDSRMAGGGAGPGDGFEVDLTLNLGTGLDYRIGRHWIAGGGAGFSLGLAEKSRSLEGDLHIGYGW